MQNHMSVFSETAYRRNNPWFSTLNRIQIHPISQKWGRHFLPPVIKIDLTPDVFAKTFLQIKLWTLSKRTGFAEIFGKKDLKSGEKNQCLPDSWSICHLCVWIASFRDSRYRAAGARLRVTFCGLAGYRPILWSAKVRPAYRTSSVALKIVRNGKSPVLRSIRSTGLKLDQSCWNRWICSQ